VSEAERSNIMKRLEKGKMVATEEGNCHNVCFSLKLVQRNAELSVQLFYLC